VKEGAGALESKQKYTTIIRVLRGTVEKKAGGMSLSIPAWGEGIRWASSQESQKKGEEMDSSSINIELADRYTRERDSDSSLERGKKKELKKKVQKS